MVNQHQSFMDRALSLSLKGKGKVSPNPLVGCVIVKGNQIVGEGFHEFYGGPHAEVNALKQAGKRAKGATAYVTLEPCSHFGKTPPCAPELIKNGIKTVYVSIKDPNPQVSGKGINILKRNGIKVHVGLEAEKATSINKPFLHWMKAKRPYTILKMAMSLDGKTATRTGDSKWISGKESRKSIHQLRTEVDAILIGANTAIEDNPQLTSHGLGKNPIRIILDPKLRTSTKLTVYKTQVAPTWIVCGENVSPSKVSIFENLGIKILKFNIRFGEINPRNIMSYLSKNNVSQVLLEGGSNTAWRFLKAGCIDEINFYVAPTLVGGNGGLTPIGGKGFEKIRESIPLKNLQLSKVGTDLLIKGFIS